MASITVSATGTHQKDVDQKDDLPIFLINIFLIDIFPSLAEMTIKAQKADVIRRFQKSGIR